MNAPEPNQVSAQDMVHLLHILAGDSPAIINPELLLELSGEVFEDIDIYGLAAALEGLRGLIRNSCQELGDRITALENPDV